METGYRSVAGISESRAGSPKKICRKALKQQWVAPDGRARVEVAPNGNTDDTEVFRSFARAVLAVYPNATGGPISILRIESHRCQGIF